jgi:hypothetical protein
MPNVLNEQWLETHPEYSPESDPFVAIVEQAFAEGTGTFNGLTPTDVRDLHCTYSLIRTGDELARGEGWKDLAIGAVLENGPPLAGAVGQAHNHIGSAAMQAMALVDFPTKRTRNWSAYFNSEGEARQLARQKLGQNPLEVEPGKWRSQDGKWQYRAKPGDIASNHIHLEELDPATGEVLQNVHLRW